ncbi:hypothetical protein [Flavobacterium cheniae]|uniref:Lipoprotein n=1 Tax=Flavobacterium cheniae TaxID=295428 RepID=A0A562KJU2_9FLAO|nr:hypothetical protein [Flavobacterium cheniae]TDR26040.1 hypothetical protein C8D80_0831 [Flavobacterium cheniae]TWH95646.1 hypothetical protein IP97_01324 [Flavobacterium cheniae]
MTKFFFLILLFFLLSCKSHFTNNNYNFKLIKIEKLTNHKLLSYSNNVDTFMVVTKNNISENCIEKNLTKFSIQSNDKINKLIDNDEEIYFEYFTKVLGDENKKISTSTGNLGKNKRRIHSYNSLPYYFENCDD